MSWNKVYYNVFIDEKLILSQSHNFISKDLVISSSFLKDSQHGCTMINSNNSTCDV